MVGEAAGGGGEAEGVPGGEGGVPAARVQEVGGGHLASHDSDVRPWCTVNSDASLKTFKPVSLIFLLQKLKIVRCYDEY